MKKFQKIAKKVVNVNNILVKASLGTSATDAEVLQLTRKELIQNLKYNKEVTEKTKSSMMKRLSDLLLELQGISKTHFRLLDDLYFGVVLKEWLIARGLELRRDDMLILAEAHFEVWLRQGISAETIHLQRARELYKLYITAIGVPSAIPAQTWLQYCKVLMYLGDPQAASTVITTVVTTFENDPDVPIYLLFAGAVFKALGQSEMANNYFFEATQIGPPKLFSKMEMMLIISRVLEEMDTESDGNEGAYRIVYEHLQLEGQIPEELDYDDWLSDSKTWVNFGDKCAIYQMYSSAADFYALGILKDPNAFRKPMLWYRFAKSCSRCGRQSDAELAIVQALTKAPHNQQLLRAKKYWVNKESRNKYDYSQLMLTEMPEIIRLVPYEIPHAEKVFLRCQGICKGIIERLHLASGVGKRKDITKKMSAKLGLILEESYPLLLSCTTNWMGKISYLSVFDVARNKKGRLNLKVPFLPMRESSNPRKLKLTLTTENETTTLIINGREKVTTKHYLIFKFVDDETGEYVYRRMVIKYDDDGHAVPTGKRLSIVDDVDINAFKSARQAREDAVNYVNAALAGPPTSDKSSSNHTAEFASAPSSVNSSPTIKSWKTLMKPFSATSSPVVTSEVAAVSATGSDVWDLEPVDRRMSFIEEYLDSRHQRSTHQPIVAKPKFNQMYIDSESGKSQMQTITNITSSNLLRTGFGWKSKVYLLRCTNELDVTMISIIQVDTDFRMIFLLKREFIDRSQSSENIWKTLMAIAEANAAVAPMLLGEQVTKDMKAMTDRAIEVLDGVHCFVNYINDDKSVCIVLANSARESILGTGFEVLEKHSIPEGSENDSDSVYRRISSPDFRTDPIDEFLDGNLNVDKSTAKKKKSLIFNLEEKTDPFPQLQISPTSEHGLIAAEPMDEASMLESSTSQQTDTGLTPRPQDPSQPESEQPSEVANLPADPTEISSKSDILDNEEVPGAQSQPELILNLDQPQDTPVSEEPGATLESENALESIKALNTDGDVDQSPTAPSEDVVPQLEVMDSSAAIAVTDPVTTPIALIAEENTTDAVITAPPVLEAAAAADTEVLFAEIALAPLSSVVEPEKETVSEKIEVEVESSAQVVITPDSAVEEVSDSVEEEVVTIVETGDMNDVSAVLEDIMSQVIQEYGTFLRLEVNNCLQSVVEEVEKGVSSAEVIITESVLLPIDENADIKEILEEIVSGLETLQRVEENIQINFMKDSLLRDAIGIESVNDMIESVVLAEVDVESVAAYTSEFLIVYSDSISESFVEEGVVEESKFVAETLWSEGMTEKEDAWVERQREEESAMLQQEMEEMERIKLLEIENEKLKLAEEARLLAESKQRQREEARNKLLDEEREKRRKEADAKQREKEEILRLEEEFRRKKAELASVPYTVTKIKSGRDRAVNGTKRDVFTPTLQKSIKRQPISLFSVISESKIQLPGYALESAEGLKRALLEDVDDMRSATLSPGSVTFGGRQTFSRPLEETSLSGNTRGSTSNSSISKSQRKKTLGSESLKPIKMHDSEKNKFREAMFRQSLEGYKTMGYVDKQPLIYATHWNKKVTDYLNSLPSARKLRKRISTLQRTSPVELTIEERVCALADTSGNVGEVIEKVKSIEYCSELKLASGAVDVRGLVTSLPGGSDIFAHSMAGGSAGSADYGSDEQESLDGTISTMSQNGSSSIAGSTGHFNLNYDMIKPSEVTEMRLRTMENNSPSLPKLNISKGSPFVQSRANFFTSSKSQSDFSKTSLPLSQGNNNNSMLNEFSKSDSNSSRRATTTSKLSYKLTSKTINESLLKDMGIEIAPPPQLDGNNDANYEYEGNEAQKGMMGMRRLSQTANGVLKSPSGFDEMTQASIGSTTTHKSHRFAAQFNTLFDELQSGEPVAMITRKDANNAQRDEILLKSDKFYIREFVEERAARMIQQKSMFNQTF